MTNIVPDTMIRVSRQVKSNSNPTDRWTKPELYALAPWKHVPEILKWRHRDAALRVKRELERGATFSLAYDGSSNTCYRLAVEPVDRSH